MGKLHDHAVEEIYETLDFLINEYDREVFWDEVYAEQDYFKGQIRPDEVRDYQDRGKQVGEFDVLLVSEVEDGKNWMKYFEVKPYSSGTSYAEDQTERAEDFWEPRGWNVLTEIYRVPEWAENWYDEERSVDVDSLEEASTKYEADMGDPDIDRYITDLEEQMKNEFR